MRIQPEAWRHGLLHWMANNAVAANLLMFILIVGGFLVGRGVKQEVFPEFDLDLVTVSVAYPGASPSDVEEGVLLVLEEAIRGLDGIKRVTSTATEGRGSLSAELLLGADKARVAADIKAAVDRIVTFPQDAERPVVSQVSHRREVISVVVYGQVDEGSRRLYAEHIREDLLSNPGISQVDLAGARPLEISIEVPQSALRRYNLTLGGIANSIRRGSVELPAGGVKTEGGEILLRTNERRDEGAEFGDISVLAKPDGSRLRVSEIAKIKDGFEDNDQFASFNGQPATMINVYRVGDETPVGVSDAVRAYIAGHKSKTPKGLSVALWLDNAEIYRDRVDLLMRNARLGLVLVLVILGAFLEFRLAFWVTMGIPTSFLGSLLLMPMMGVTINMISLFAFIITLGMVVDDAIVVGENVYARRKRGQDPLRAAVEGVREMATPVGLAVLTSIVAFSPLFFVPGFMGKIFRVIPGIVVSVLIISLVESLLVLPAHLAHMKVRESRGPLAWIGWVQSAFSTLVERFIFEVHAPVLRVIVRWRYLVIASSLAILIVTVGWVLGGRIAFTFMPKVESDLIKASVVLPYGAPVDQTRAILKRVSEAATAVVRAHGGARILRGVYAELGSLPKKGGAHTVGGLGGGHLGGVTVFLVPSDERPVSAAQFARAWREEVGEIPGLESLTFDYTTGPSGGNPVDVELSHKDMDVLQRAAEKLAVDLHSYAGVKDIDDGFAAGKSQLTFRIRPVARAAGLTADDLGRQVRSAFWGAEARRRQRGRDEIRVMVRLPKSERVSEQDIESLMLRTPSGGEIPLSLAADVERGRSYTSIQRLEGRRVVHVTADISPLVTTADKVLRGLKDKALPQLKASSPGLVYDFGGEQRERKESLEALGSSYVVAMLVIFALLAIPFRSYFQPIVVLSAIPFGVVGAVIGHVIMGFNLSLISMMGIVALSGVVVNDSLVLVDAANQKNRELQHPLESVLWAGVRRFRPIILTSLTTFFGLAPMILETSVQARFLIPMAISLGFGVMFSTFITLALVPCLYMVIEDLRGFFGIGSFASSDLSAGGNGGQEGALVSSAVSMTASGIAEEEAAG